MRENTDFLIGAFGVGVISLALQLMQRWIDIKIFWIIPVLVTIGFILIMWYMLREDR